MRLHNERVKSLSKHYALSRKESESAIKLMDDNLSWGYSSVVVEMALKDQINVTSQVVRHVKHGSYKNSFIFNHLIDLASKIKAGEVAVLNKLKEIKTN